MTHIINNVVTNAEEKLNSCGHLDLYTQYIDGKLRIVVYCYRCATVHIIPVE